MAEVRTMKKVLEAMAERYGLSVFFGYDWEGNELEIEFRENGPRRIEKMRITDVKTRDVKDALDKVESRIEEVFKISNGKVPTIKNVIRNDPATIVLWADGTKTVVKCQDGDIYDPEKGLAMAISKKALGNKGNYCNTMKKWLPEEEEEVVELTIGLDHIAEAAKEAGEAVKKVTLKAANIGAIFGKGKDK